MSTMIAVSTFASDRHVPNSPRSHYNGTWEELVALVELNFSNAKPGYKNGVLEVPVPPDGFFTPMEKVTPETQLIARFEARREGEKPFVTVRAKGTKKPAKVVNVILYSREVLAENNENSVDADWEIVSVNARVTEEPEPQTPMAMARNMLGLTGGTNATYTAEQFARAILYWSDVVPVELAPEV